MELANQIPTQRDYRGEVRQLLREVGAGPAFRVGHRHWRLPFGVPSTVGAHISGKPLTGDKKKKEKTVNDYLTERRESNSDRNNINIVVYNF